MKSIVLFLFSCTCVFSRDICLIFSGYFSICQLILENVIDKNPEDGFGTTPLFLADQHGHTLICELIKESMEKTSKRRRTD